MNANQNTGIAGKRLNRIKTVSFYLKVLIGLGLVAGIPYEIAVYFGWWPLPAGRKILISPHQLYASASEIPTTILALGLVRLGLYAFCLVVLYNLFRLYEKGVLFSAKNVLYIRLLGYYLVIDWIALDQLESLSHKMALSLAQAFTGLIIIFVAWIMDEARRMQEEQDLTV